MATEIKVPVLGESVTEGTIAEWLKQPGEAVAVDEPIASLETDKVAVDVPSPVAGVMSQHVVAVGDTVEVGAVIAIIEDGASAPAPAPAAAPAAAKADTPAPAASEELLTPAQTMSPAVRRAVLEHGVDPSTIKGTGKDGRLTKEDVLAAAEAKAKSPATPAPAPAAAAAPAAPVASGGAPVGTRGTERVKMTRMRQTIAKRLKAAQDNAAMLTTFN
ncbi:MAG TPA: biotin/lipoyl-containing protein, partial [Erythrobacter sp.]